MGEVPLIGLDGVTNRKKEIKRIEKALYHEKIMSFFMELERLKEKTG